MNRESFSFGQALSLSVILLCLAAGPEAEGELNLLAFLDGGCATAFPQWNDVFCAVFLGNCFVSPHCVSNHSVILGHKTGCGVQSGLPFHLLFPTIP